MRPWPSQARLHLVLLDEAKKKKNRSCQFSLLGQQALKTLQMFLVVIKVLKPKVVDFDSIRVDSIRFEIFFTFIDFRLTDALHIKWAMHQKQPSQVATPPARPQLQLSLCSAC